MGPEAGPEVYVDHLIVAVLDRDTAAADFETLGFTTVEGGVHPGGKTHNRVISLAQGPYIELVSPTDLADLATRYPDDNTQWLFCFNAGQGFIGFALGVPDIDAVAHRLQAAGYELNGPHLEGRTLPDGRLAQVRGLSVLDTRYPAAVCDVTPREWRRPALADGERHHRNGTTAVARIVAMVHDIDEATKRYEAITGVQPTKGWPVRGARTSDFAIAGTTLTIAEPFDRGSAMFEDLQLRGETAFLVQLRTDLPAEAGPMDLTSTHRARFELT